MVGFAKLRSRRVETMGFLGVVIFQTQESRGIKIESNGVIPT